MKKLALFLVAMLSLLSVYLAVPATSTTVCGSGHHAFCDDFSGTSLNTAKWQPNWFGASNTSVTKPVNGGERACYDPKQVSTGNGMLRLDLVHRSCTASNGVTYPEATGAVSTLHSFTFSTGTLVARVHLIGNAMVLYNWPAVWTDGLCTWPHCGESDVFEGLGGKACWHYHSDTGGPGNCVQMGAGWHTFSETVENGTATYSYDGHVVGSLAAVNAQHFIIMGNQSGTYGGQDVAGRMKVDYIYVDTP